MVDPRRPSDRPDDGTHPRQPNVGGPAPDRPPAGPGDPRRKHRLMTGIAIAVAIAIIIVAGLLLAPTFGLIDTADAPAAPPPAEQTAAPAAQAPKAQPGDCRDFEKTVEIGGEARTVTGRACMQPDGSWKVVD